MAVTSVVEINEERGGSFNEDGTREYTRAFLVTTSSQLDGPLTVRQATGLPRRFDLYLDANAAAIDAGARCVEIRESPTDNPYVWRVVCRYSSKSLSDTRESEGDENPLNRPAKVAWTFQQFTRPTDTCFAINDDTSLTVITNSAGERFDPPIEIDDSRLVLTYTRNEASYSPGTAIFFQDAVNEDFFIGAAPGTAKIQAITANSANENNVFFWEVTYEIHFRREGFDRVILDAGFRQLDYTNDPPTLVNITDANGQNVQTPYPLDGIGQKLEDGGTPVFNSYRVYRRLPFFSLGIV